MTLTLLSKFEIRRFSSLQERWKALQAQKRMEAMQDALNGEQRLFMEKLSRDRSEIQRSKDQLLDEQKIALASIYESRSQLADERAKVEALQKAFQEQKHRDMLQNATVKSPLHSYNSLCLLHSDRSRNSCSTETSFRTTHSS